MNYEKGGLRILKVCAALLVLICGAVGIGWLPDNIVDSMQGEINDSLWRARIEGIGFGALISIFIFYDLMNSYLTEDKPLIPAKTPAPRVFLLSFWGMISTFIGWMLSLIFLIAGKTWPELALDFMYSGKINAGISTLVIIAITWLIPIGFISLFIWLWRGFFEE